jgi:tetratricopeptide (TPR) repeat protein
MKGWVKMRKILFVFPLVVLFFFMEFFFICCGPKKPEITPQQLAQYNMRIKEADAHYYSGCYVRLQKAFELYEEALDFPIYKRKNGGKLLKTAILLGLREKELGFFKDTYLHKASDIIKAYPMLSDCSVYLKIASSIPRKTVGIVGDLFETGSRIIVPYDDIKDDISSWEAFLNERSESDVFFAYLTISYYSPFSYLIKGGPDLEKLGEIFKDFPLMRYKLSLYPEVDPEGLKKLVSDEPNFHEVYFFLGSLALKNRELIKAEKNLLKAYDHFPQSLSLLMSLASVYFAFEELEKSMEFEEEILAIAPTHRDALLGKAMCLSYLGRHREAADVCRNMIRLGEYYMGEAHYWLAWNQNELKEYESAWTNIQKSKDFLIGYEPVYYLAGLIAFNQNRLDEAEENLKLAYKLNPSNGDSLYYLGKIKSIQEDWLTAGTYFEKAGMVYEQDERSIQRKIEEIQGSSFSEQRKKNLLSKKARQLQKTKLSKATAWYNAAAGYYNADEKEKAVQMAEKAAIHSAFKEKAEELLKLIKIK